MAPTEVLASQHYNGTLKFLEHSGVKTALLTLYKDQRAPRYPRRT